MLLIEFDDKKPFSLQGKYYLSKDLQSSDIVAKLQLLTMHFPKLRKLFKTVLSRETFNPFIKSSIKSLKKELSDYEIDR